MFFLSSTAAFCKTPVTQGRTGNRTANHKQTTPALYPKRSKLKASVSLNEYFPPLPEALRPGAIFNVENIEEPSASKEDLWYMVPSWIAGEYSYGQTTTYLTKDMKTGIETHVSQTRAGLAHGRNRGIIVDKAGNIWQRAYGGGIVDPTNPYIKDGVQLKKYDDELFGMIISPDRYVENSAGVEFFVDTASGKISETMRWERIRDFNLEKDGSVTVDVSEETFDIDGNPIRMNKARGTMLKRNAFVPLTSSSDPAKYADSVGSLRKFMENRGSLSDAPDEPAVSTDKEPAKE
jgi:hypothetical protein